MKQVKYKEDLGNLEESVYDVEYVEFGSADYHDSDVINVTIKAAHDECWAESHRGVTVAEINDTGDALEINLPCNDILYSKKIHLDYSTCSELFLALHIWRQTNDFSIPRLFKIKEEVVDVVEE